MSDYDVVIAGFGPTGALAANLLGKQNIKTLVVDPQNEIYDIPRGVHFDGETMRIFQSLGLAEDIFAQCATNESLNFVNRKGSQLMHVNLGDLPQTQGWPASLFFRQPLVEKKLRDNLGQFDSVSVKLGWALGDFEQDEDGVSVSLKNVETGATQNLRATYLIGADGADSHVRQTLGVVLDDKKCDEPWLVVDWELEADVGFNRDAYQFCDPARPGTLVPCAGQHIRWEFMINPGDDIAALEDEANVRRLMAPYVPLLSPDLSAQQGKLLRAKMYEFHGLLARQMRVGRVFLMGDAAHQMPPFLGQGMCSGLRDAENLVWKLAGVLRGQYRESLLDSYHSERYTHVKEVIHQAVQIGAVIQTRNRFKAFLRDSFLRLGKLIPKLLSGIEFGKTWRLGPGLVSGDGASGRQILQPQIHQPAKDAPHEKLDGLLPDGFSLVLLEPSLEADMGAVCAAHKGLACALVVLGAARQETDGWLRAHAAAHNAVGFILRPDRQIYAALTKKGAPIAQQLDAHLADLTAQVLATG